MTEKVQKTPAEIEEQAFLKGFEDETVATGRPDQPKTEVTEKQAAATSEPPKTEVVKPEPKKPVPVKPKDEFVRLTKTDYEALKTNAGKVPELEKRVETAFGKFGPIQQMLNELKAATPKGQTVEISDSVLDEAVAELKAEYPDLAGNVKSALKIALKAGLTGTGKSDAAPDEVVKTKLEEFAMARAFEDLDEVHPAWREIVGFAAPGQADPNNKFRAWLAKQPQEYQDKINNTRNPTVTANAITKFKLHQREVVKPAPVVKKVVNKVHARKVLARKNRIQGSVQPKGLGTPPPAQRQSEEDAFASGFQNG